MRFLKLLNWSAIAEIFMSLRTYGSVGDIRIFLGLYNLEVKENFCNEVKEYFGVFGVDFFQFRVVGYCTCKMELHLNLHTRRLKTYVLTEQCSRMNFFFPEFGPIEKVPNSVKNFLQHKFLELDQKTRMPIARVRKLLHISWNSKGSEELWNLMRSMPHKFQQELVARGGYIEY